MKVAIYALAVIIVVAIVAAVFYIEYLLLTFAWSAFMVPVFGLPELTTMQAIGAIVLLGLIGGAFKATSKS